MASILDNLAVSLTPFQIEKIRLIEEFDFSATKKRVLKDFDYAITNSYLDYGIYNLKMYYIVALLDPLNEHAVSRLVDPFWHAHILHTEEYIGFCDLIYKQYIQHKPLDEDDKSEVDYVGDLYRHTLDVYMKIFKKIDSEWWPDATIEGGIQRPQVCRHMHIYDAEIRSQALFPSIKAYAA